MARERREIINDENNMAEKRHLDEIFSLAAQHHQKGNYKDAESLYKQILEVNPTHYQSLGNLGLLAKQFNKYNISKRLLEKAIQISPNFANAHYNLGNTYQELGETQQAINCYQQAIDLYDHVLISNPNDRRVLTSRQSTLHLLNSQVGVTTKTAPKHYIQSLFDDYAKRFDHHLTETLDYKVPQLLKNRLTTQLGSNLTFDMAIDLGCGTGLSGEAFRPICRLLVGIDLSPNMLDIAKKKEVYDVIENIDINKYLNNDLEKYDLFIATDVLIYIGDLSQLFSNISGASKSGAVFLFSTESTNTNDYLLTNQGRYAHSDKYVNQLARLHQFTILNVENTILRTEEGKGVDGQLFILKYLG